MNRLKLVFFSLVIGSRLLLPQLFGGQDGPASTNHLAEPHHEAQFPALLQGGFQYWDKGYLITHAWDGTLHVSPNKPGVVLYDKDGHIAREAVVWLGGSRSVSVGDAAVSQSGHLVASGVTENEKGVIANFIAEIGSDDRVHRVVRTSPFLPVYVCALEDGTVWSYGEDRDDDLNGIQDSLRLRHYSFEKGRLRALLDTSGLNQGWVLSRGRYPGEISFRCNSKTVVLYNGASGELVEFDLRTNALKITKVASLPQVPEFKILGFALTESGDIFASFHDRSQKPVMSGLFRLGRDNAGGAKWVPVEGTVGPYLHGSPIERLMGADGDDLVYTSLKDGKMFWSKQSTQ